MSTQPAPSTPPRLTGAERTRRWRERMRAKGLVPRTVWTYDVNDPAFLEERRLAGERIRGSEDERRVLEEIEALYELNEPVPAWTQQSGDCEEG